MPLAVFSDWWNELTLAKQLFYGIGLIAGLVSVIMVILSFVGFDHHDGVDAADLANPDGHDGALGILSLKTVTGFFLGFGWGGAIAMDQGLNVPLATLVGLASGGLIMAVVMLMFRAIMALRSDGTMDIKATVGCVGTVYLTLPPSRAAGGQVVVNFNGRQETFPALNSSDQSIASGDKVRVLEVVDSRTLLVAPLS